MFRLGIAASAAIVLVYVLFFHHLDQRDLWNSHEARAGQNAQSILDTGDWLLPRLYDGRVEMQKPPLYYWLVALAARARSSSVDAWAVRMPSALAAALVLAALFALGWLRRRPWMGACAAGIIATMLHFTWIARVGRIDVPLTLATATALVGYYLATLSIADATRWTRLRSLLGQTAAYLGLAAGVLLKGPIGLVLPGTVIVLHLFLERGTWRALGWREAARRLGTWWGVPLFLILVIPWFWIANERTGGAFTQTFFWKHNLDRGFGGDPDIEANPDAWWFYLVRLGPDLFPWSLLLALAVLAVFRNGWWGTDPEVRFGLAWWGGMLVFLSLMRFKRADYLLPAYPGAALMLGAVLERWLAAVAAATQRRCVAGLVAVMAAVALGWLVAVDVYLPRGEPQRELRTFADFVRQRVPRPGQVVIFQAESHLLGFHLGKPLERLLEWDNLDVWAAQPTPTYVILTERAFGEWEQRLECGQLRRITSTSELARRPHEQPLVFCVTVPPSPADDHQDERFMGPAAARASRHPGP